VISDTSILRWAAAPHDTNNNP